MSRFVTVKVSHPIELAVARSIAYEDNGNQARDEGGTLATEPAMVVGQEFLIVPSPRVAGLIAITERLLAETKSSLPIGVECVNRILGALKEG